MGLKGVFNINKNKEMLELQLKMLKDKANGEEITYHDIAEMRSRYLGKKENVTNVRKGAKMLNEYIANDDFIVDTNRKTKTSPQKSDIDSVEYSWSKDKVEIKRMIEIPKGVKLTKEKILELHDMDEDEWELLSYRNNYWGDVDGGYNCYQSRITVKPKSVSTFNPEKIKKLFSELREIKPLPSFKGKNKPNDRCVVLPLADIHYNLLAVKSVTRGDYNRDIARSYITSIINDVKSRINWSNVEKIIFPMGNDLFNANGITGTTFNGTPQDNETHIFDAFKELFDFFTEIIYDLTTNCAPMDVIYIPSNHDKEIGFYFLHSLQSFFKNYDKVNVDIEPYHNKYIKFGTNLLAFAHNMKEKDVSPTILAEAKHLLDGIQHTEVLLAHLHKESVLPIGETMVRRLPTISMRSKWTAENNYNSPRCAQTFIYDKELGITDILFSRTE